MADENFVERTESQQPLVGQRRISLGESQYCVLNQNITWLKLLNKVWVSTCFGGFGSLLYHGQALECFTRWDRFEMFDFMCYMSLQNFRFDIHNELSGTQVRAHTRMHVRTWFSNCFGLFRIVFNTFWTIADRFTTTSGIKKWRKEGFVKEPNLNNLWSGRKGFLGKKASTML